MGGTTQALIGNDATSHNSDQPSATSDMDPSYQNSSIDASSDGEKTPADRRRACPWGKLLVGAVLLGVVIYVVVDATTTKNIQRGFQIFLEWIEENVLAGVFSFMGVYFVATVCFVPGSILTLGSGFVFGKAVGLGPGVALATAAVFVGASLGAIARYVVREEHMMCIVHCFDPCLHHGTSAFYWGDICYATGWAGSWSRNIPS